MKVLLYIHRYGIPQRRFIRNGIAALTARGYELRIITDEAAGPVATADPRVRVLPVALRPTWPHRLENKLRKAAGTAGYERWRRARHYTQPVTGSYAAALRAAVADFAPDLIHVHFGFSLFWLMDALGEHPPSPVLVTFRGVDASAFPRVRGYRRRLRRLLRHPAVHTSSVCQALADRLRAFGIALPRHHLLYTAIDVDFYRRQARGLPELPRRFVQISSLNAKKGLLLTVRAFHTFAQRYPGRAWRLDIAGAGPLRGELETLIATLGRREEVQLLGQVSPEMGKSLLEQAHVFVHHSLTPASGDMEGIPNAVLEAMSMELPVLTSRHAGIPEAVTDGVHGELVPEGRLEAYVAAIGRIFDRPHCGACRKRVVQRFSMDRHAAQLMTIYRTVAPDSV